MTIIRLRYVHYYAYFIKYLLINLMVEVWALFYKIPLNKPNDNYCRGVSHKPPFEVLPSEYDGGAAIVRHGQVSKWHSRNKIHAQGRNVHPLIRTYNEHRYCMCYLLKPSHKRCSSRQSSLCIFSGGSL